MVKIAELLTGDGPARLERELLLAHLLKKDRGWLYAHGHDVLSNDLSQAFSEGCRRLAAAEPLAYVLGEWEFFSLPLQVNSATLIPRPETELLVEQALSWLDPATPARVLDLGTGTGAIALAIAAHRPLARVTATDVSSAALAVAADNARRLGLTDIDFRHGHWWQAVAGQVFDLVISNPPYVADNDPHLDAPGEPELALMAGPDGMSAFDEIIPQTRAHLRPGGCLMLEHGYHQRPALVSLLGQHSAQVDVYDDLAGVPRIVTACWR